MTDRFPGTGDKEQLRPLRASSHLWLWPHHRRQLPPSDLSTCAVPVPFAITGTDKVVSYGY